MQWKITQGYILSRLFKIGFWAVFIHIVFFPETQKFDRNYDTLVLNCYGGIHKGLIDAAETMHCNDIMRGEVNEF